MLRSLEEAFQLAYAEDGLNFTGERREFTDEFGSRLRRLGDHELLAGGHDGDLEVAHETDALCHSVSHVITVLPDSA